MMVANNRPFSGEVPKMLHNLLADNRVCLDSFVLFRGKRFGFEQYRVTNADLTDVMEKTRYRDNILLFLATSHLGCKGSGIVTDTLGMRSRVWISSFQSCHE